ncbi:hypothetical protein PMAYCL1PPCAC_20007, partial [Pristionchus mayeri]
PVHWNLVLVTLYKSTWVSLSIGARAGLILFESGAIPFNHDEVPSLCLILSFLRLYGIISMSQFGFAIYAERWLALYFVRDYEYYLPGYKLSMLSMVPYFFFYFAIRSLYAENELRLEHLNQRDIRPNVTRRGRFPRSVQKFFGDHSKDMYTLSLRLQLDENIWCCRQISRANHIFITGVVSITLFITIPPLFSYTQETAWILMVFASILMVFASIV